jgi:hypothetical protein
VEEVYAVILRHRGDHCPETCVDVILINCHIRIRAAPLY